jgi:hypothetical protein
MFPVKLNWNREVVLWVHEHTPLAELELNSFTEMWNCIYVLIGIRNRYLCIFFSNLFFPVSETLKTTFWKHTSENFPPTLFCYLKTLRFKIYKTIVLAIVFVGCETASLRWRPFHSMCAGCWKKREEVAENWKKFHEVLQNVHSSPNAVEVI